MTEKIFHHNDADGRCAGAIAAKYLSDNGLTYDLIEVDYKDRVPEEVVQSGDMVIVLDFSFKPDLMARIRKIARTVIWCDHHATAKDYGYDDVNGLRDFSNKGLSGCECTWKFFFPKYTIPYAVHLIGDYDSWRLEDPDCFAFYEGLKLRDTSASSPLWNELFDSFTYSGGPKIMHDGRVAIRYRDAYCKEMRYEFGYETTILGHKAFAMNVAHFGSKQFGEEFSIYPVCIAYIYDGYKFTVSLYSETVDVSVIAKKLGGGGHAGASGFTCEELPFSTEDEVKQ